MKKKFVSIIAIACLVFATYSCSYIEDMFDDDPYVDPSEMLGDVMFWTDESNGGIISVTFRNATMSITSYYSSGIPDCGAKGCATYENVPIGTYSFSARNSIYTWSGEVTIREGWCRTMRLFVNKGKSMEEEDSYVDVETSEIGYAISDK